ncbi:MAG: Gfo/Idh/MocA family oxidoreductase [Oscillospiraceae bacterium]|jgi:predicted dehydrogenase|nr:Gfo/Idh/MocA family oxidoreductase [Oscillospiraceae bacterium]
MAAQLRAALVGCGAIAQVHAGILKSLPGAYLCACADIRVDRAQALAAAHGMTAYDSLDALLASESIDVLHILTPHALHLPMAEAAAARGIAIFTEKPPAITRQQWRQWQALAGRVPVGICFQNRYNAATQAARALLTSGEAGRVLGARGIVTWRRDAAYYSQSGWRGTRALEGGGALMNQGIHTLDLLVHLLGAPEGVQVSMHNRHLPGVIEVEDTLEARWCWGDAPGLFYATTAYGVDAPVLLDIACEKATLRIEGGARYTVTWADGRETREDFAMDGVLGKNYWGNGHEPCIRDFYRCLRAGEAFPIGVADVANTMELVLTLYEQGIK